MSFANSKRARVDNGWSDSPWVALNVGGQRFETTSTLLEEKTTYFKSMFDQGVPEEGVFIDRDPEAFAVLLRFLRTGVIGGLLPKADPALCSAVLAEAEYFGVSTLLEPVKATAYRNLSLRWMTTTQMDEAIKYNDFTAATAFDSEVGSITEALDKGVLPARYFGPERRVVQALVPPASTTWVLIGIISDEPHDYYDGAATDEDELPAYPVQPKEQMRYWRPSCVRRVVFFANVELDGVRAPEPEALILLTEEDQEAWMRESSAHKYLDPEGLMDVLSHGQRLLTVSDFIASPAFTQRRGDASTRDIWTRIVVSDYPPAERPARRVS